MGRLVKPMIIILVAFGLIAFGAGGFGKGADKVVDTGKAVVKTIGDKM